jgi:CheY-like chemotaxis protein
LVFLNQASRVNLTDMNKKPNLLIVDDDHELRKTICEVVQTLGYDLYEADSGSVALKQIIARRPDLIISDFSMENGNGLDLAMALTKHKLKIPFILLTGRRELHTDCYSEPSINHIVFKPFKPQDLLSLVQDMLRDKHQAD